jgi:hypothetical protein
MLIKSTIVLASALVMGTSSVALTAPTARDNHPVAAKTTAPAPSMAGKEAYGYAWTQSRKEPTYMEVQDQFYRDSLGQ